MESSSLASWVVALTCTRGEEEEWWRGARENGHQIPTTVEENPVTVEGEEEEGM